ESEFEILAAHMDEKPTPLRELNPEVQLTDELEQVVMRCLAKNPDMRFASMKDVARAMLASVTDTGAIPSAQSWLRSGKYVALAGSGGALDEGSSPPRSPAVAEVLPSSAAIVVPKDDSGKSRTLLFAAGGALVAVAVILVMVFAGGGSDGGDASSSAADEPVPALADEPEATPADEVAAEAPTGEAVAEQPVDPTAAAVPGQQFEPVYVTSEPPGATIRRDGRFFGKTPVTIQIPAGQTWTFQLTKEGYVERSIEAVAGAEAAAVELIALAGSPPSDSADEDSAELSDSERRRAARERRRARRDRERAAEEPKPAEQPAVETPAKAPDKPRRRTENPDPWAQ
ncbi:MAG: PEGA domain-containing protein, partial [Myxococcota bacterium]